MMKTIPGKSKSPSLILMALVLGLHAAALATPSTTYWSPCVIDIQPFNVWHVTYDNYTTLGKQGPAKGGSAFPNDLGLTVGILPFDSLQMEIGVDMMEPQDFPWSFNAKLGAPEGALFSGSPALEFGVFNLGTEWDVTNQDIAYVVFGRSLPVGLGRLHLGAYLGNDRVLKSFDGTVDSKGLMAGYDYGFWNVKSADGDYNRFVIAGDYMSGKNAVGGGGGGLYVYFSKNIDLLAGPVWFNDRDLNGDWKWTTQMDVNF